jgi:hypothetical protein
MENELGRELTNAEERKLYNEATCLMVTTCGHAKVSRTYGGRNSMSRIQLDAEDLRAAQELDLEAHRDRLRQEGHTEAQIESAFEGVRRRNRAQGIK